MSAYTTYMFHKSILYVQIAIVWYHTTIIKKSRKLHVGKRKNKKVAFKTRIKVRFDTEDYHNQESKGKQTKFHFIFQGAWGRSDGCTWIPSRAVGGPSVAPLLPSLVVKLAVGVVAVAHQACGGRRSSSSGWKAKRRAETAGTVGSRWADDSSLPPTHHQHHLHNKHVQSQRGGRAACLSALREGQTHKQPYSRNQAAKENPQTSRGANRFTGYHRDVS